MRSHVDKEATLAEVMDEVSLRDLDGQLKAVFAGLGCLAVFFIIGLGEAGLAASGYGFTVPNVVWIGFCVFITVMAFTADTSHHRFETTIFFPRLRFVGWLLWSGYITVTIEAFRYSSRITDSVTRDAATFGVYLVLAMPAWLFIYLMQLGYERLMAKRTAGDDEQLDD